MNSMLRSRVVMLALVAAMLGVLGLAPVRATADVKPGGFMSSNVTWIANLPLETTAIGARIVEVDGTPRMYLTTLGGGLSIYDLSNPIVPVLMGHLPLPHWENEDVAVSDDGATALITSDRLLDSNPMFVIDTSNPHAPVLASILHRSAHTVTCADDACDWVYSSEGEIYDLRDKRNPKIHGSWYAAVQGQGVSLRQGAHDLNRDAAGYLVTDTVPRIMLDVSDPTAPVVLTTSQSEDAAGETAYQHNNLRPRATEWQPRAAGDSSGALRPGELLLSNGETNFTQLGLPIRPTDPARSVKTQACNGETNGPFATWDMRDWDKGRTMRPIEVFRPVSSNLDDPANEPWVDGNPQLNGFGCSGHWFDWRGDLVSAAWYEHGTRFLAVDPTTGDIDEVGFFQPVNGSAFSSYWVTDEIVYTLDTVRGIDILHFDRDGDRPSIDEILTSWTANLDPVAVQAAATDRLYCSLSVEALS